MAEKIGLRLRKMKKLIGELEGMILEIGDLKEGHVVLKQCSVFCLPASFRRASFKFEIADRQLFS